MTLTIFPAIEGDVTGPASSTDNAIVRWNGTQGVSVQNSVVTIADTTGVIAGTQGVTLSGSTSGTAALVSQAAAGTVTFTLPISTATLGYLNMPQNSQSAAYPLVLADSGKQVYHPASDANARQFTIPKNATVAYALGTCITFTNDSANDITVIIDTDTLNYVDVGAITTATIPQYNTATIQKTTTTSWLMSGSAGVTTA